ncbi:MAG TPA: hypothetical protein PLQ00_11140, partial [Thermoguttaceae bacterium]|nr:hypothetical protein [Thermoguttaceae bacterium]
LLLTEYKGAGKRETILLYGDRHFTPVWQFGQNTQRKQIWLPKNLIFATFQPNAKGTSPLRGTNLCKYQL